MLTAIEWNWDSSSLKNKKCWDELLFGYVEEIYCVTFFFFLMEKKVYKNLNT